MTVVNKTTTTHEYNNTSPLLKDKGVTVTVVTIRGDWVNKVTGQLSPYTDIHLVAHDAAGKKVAHGYNIQDIVRTVRAA